MITKIIGILWICLGFIGLIKPQIIQNFFKKKAKKKKLKILISLILFLGSFTVGLFFRFEALWIKVVIITSFIILFKVSLTISSKLGDKFNEKLSRVPQNYYRAFAIFIIIVGIILFKVI